MVIGKMPAPVGVPARVAVPSPLSVKLTPAGRAPVLVMVVAAGTPGRGGHGEGAGGSDARRWSWSALVMAGGWLTVSVKVWVASGVTPSLAVRVSGYVPPVPAAGVPARVAVPLPLSVKVTPEGRVPVALIATLPAPPAVVTVNDPAVPTTKVAWSALVIAGDSTTVSVKDWVARCAGAVGRGDRDRVLPGGAGGRGAGQGGGAVAVVGEADAGGQAAALGQSGRDREPGRGGHGEAARRAAQEGGVVGTGDGRRLVHASG